MIFIPSDQLIIFITASIVLILAPGPDIIFLITQSLHNGVKAGLATALGLACGNLAHTMFAVSGVALLLQANAHALIIIQTLGACYLLYLAYLAITESENETHKNVTTHNQQIKFFVRGLLMNILNPKVAFFFLSFLPQFIPPHTTQANIFMLWLGLYFTGLVTFIFSAIALLSQTIKQHTLFKHKHFAWLSATVFVALSLHFLLRIF